MRYILNSRYRMRGWYALPCGIYDTMEHEARFLPPNLYRLILKCDGGQEIDEETLSGQERAFVNEVLAAGVIREAGRWDFLLPEQRYKAYPARYRSSVHWSVTGACNLKCRHCFMSAPGVKHGVPSYDELESIMDQLAECGIFSVDITGGEPLIRNDFGDILDGLRDREIRLNMINTNGWLVNAELLDEVEKRGFHPVFQLSFDGLGWHDFLRGVKGAEERAVTALKLLKERGYRTNVSMCIHKKNAGCVRETVRFLADCGVTSLKFGSMLELGDWSSSELFSLQLSYEEELSLFEKYIPEYFEDDAPLSVMMSGAFVYQKNSPRWDIFYRRKVPQDKEDDALSCNVIKESLYIGPDGVVAPCQGMCDCSFGKNFPSLKSTPLREILTESAYVPLSYATVGDVRRGNDECRNCVYIDRCAGGCRADALIAGDNYYGTDPGACHFFQNGWEERITAAAQPAFEEYIKRNPIMGNEVRSDGESTQCP